MEQNQIFTMCGHSPQCMCKCLALFLLGVCLGVSIIQEWESKYSLSGYDIITCSFSLLSDACRDGIIYLLSTYKEDQNKYKHSFDKIPRTLHRAKEYRMKLSCIGTTRMKICRKHYHKRVTMENSQIR